VIKFGSTTAQEANLNPALFEFAEELAPTRRPAPQGVTTVIELPSLDEKLLMDGYLAGRSNHLNTTQTDPSYLHGYLNGLVDGGHARISSSQELLAREYVQSGALRADVARWRAANA
jgi:hypothetical protein